MAGWPFVHPEFAVAAAGAAVVPVLIHLINRRRFKRVRWGAMAFLRGAMRRSARRIRIEQWLLLLVRMAVIGLAFLAVARPYFPLLPLASLGSARMHRVVLIDNSGSMRAGREETRFSRAIGLADSLLASFPSGDAVSFVTLASPARAVVGYAGYDRRRVRDELIRIESTYRGTDLAGGFSTVLSVLEDSSFLPSDVVVYVVSDLALTSWSRGAVRSARKVANRVRRGGLVLVSVGESDAANVAVEAVRVERGQTGSLMGEEGRGGTIPLRVEAVVVNHSIRAVRDVRLQVSVGDRIARRLSVPRLGPYERRSMRFSVGVERGGARGIKVTAEGAVDDVLPGDNDRWASVEVPEGIGALLVAGRGGTGPAGAADYLATALDPGAGIPSFGDAGTGIRVRTVSARSLSAERLDEYGMVALCNVGRLEEDDWERLTEFVRGGGGLLVTGGSTVHADHYNRYGYADGAGVLPCRLETESEAGAVRGGNGGSGFTPERFAHPVLSDFSEHADSGLFLTRVRRYLKVVPHPSRCEVLMRYTNRDPAMLAGLLGAGRVIVLTTSADMSWTNLPAKGDFVSLMANVSAYLARLKGDERTLTVGESIAERLNATESSMTLRVVDPSGRVNDGRLSLSSGEFALEYGPLQRPGRYSVSVGTREAEYAVNIDAAESDLRGADEHTLREMLKCDLTFVESLSSLDASTARATTNEIGGSLLYIVLVLIVVEAWLATRFGVRR